MPPNDMIDTAERLVRVETKLDFLIKSLETGAEKHLAYENRFKALERGHNIAIGALAAGNLLVILFIEKLKGLF